MQSYHSTSNMIRKARQFVYRNARPLDLARWNYHFENGTKEDVLTYLSAYQNPDGGFGHALEPDSWNPHSTPVATWSATRVLREIGFTDASHPIIQGILRYLESGADFADGKWFNTVASNNAYPHAVWWHCDKEDGLPDDNPTVSLIGFALKYAEKDSAFYQKLVSMAKDAVHAFIMEPVNEMHTVRCFMELLVYCEDKKLTGLAQILDLETFRTVLCDTIRNTVCLQPEKWFTEYVCKPSFFYEEKQLLLDIVDRDLLEQEARMLAQQQLEDGSYPVTWKWWTDYNEYEISANWWRSALLVENMLYIRAFCKQ